MWQKAVTAPLNRCYWLTYILDCLRFLFCCFRSREMTDINKLFHLRDKPINRNVCQCTVRFPPPPWQLQLESPFPPVGSSVPRGPPSAAGACSLIPPTAGTVRSTLPTRSGKQQLTQPLLQQLQLLGYTPSVSR